MQICDFFKRRFCSVASDFAGLNFCCGVLFAVGLRCFGYGVWMRNCNSLLRGMLQSALYLSPVELAFPVTMLPVREKEKTLQQQPLNKMPHA